MHIVAELLRLSATDLANHLGCAHLSNLNLAVAQGRARRPARRDDPVALLLEERGREHERAYLARLRERGGAIVEIAVTPGADGTVETLAAMRAAADVIYQAPLAGGRWYGRADFLRKVAAPSALGAWSYEIVDAKLATETRAGTILQLCVYSELLAQLQGSAPELAHVVAPHHDFAPEPYRLAEYAAYYRLVKRRLEAALDAAPPTYPEPAQHCDVCAWWPQCNARRRSDDHLCFVAGISRTQIKELRTRLSIDTLEKLGDLTRVPTPQRGSREALTRVRDQAAIQLKARRLQARQHEILTPLGPEHGFALLPLPSPHDLFLDLEGDRLAADGGREYLFGVVGGDGAYTPLWAATPAAEKRAFGQVVERIVATFAAHPDMRVYHFGAYEPAAFKRLSGRYATRETELDRILRAELFVDLHTIVKHSLKASVESYSIKDLEPFFGLHREQDLREATASRRALEWAIERHEELTTPDLAQHVTAVERYNREDCVSARALRDWLEQLRSAAQREHGVTLPRPEQKSGDASEQIATTAVETQRVMAQLLDGVPVDPTARTEEQQARWLLAHLLEWHRREDKAAWWEYFRLKELPLDEYEEERSALAGLTFAAAIGGTARSPVHRYAFPPQDHDVRRGDEVCVPPEGTTIGTIEAIDVGAHTLDIKHASRAADTRPTQVFVKRNVRPEPKPAVLLAIGRFVAEHGFEADGAHRAARDLLLRRPPRLNARSAGIGPATSPETEVATACRLAFELDHGVLPIQGPPGTGKTFTGSHMILELVKAGRKVGVTAVSHEVIRNLLKGVCERAVEAGLTDFKCLQKARPKDDDPAALHAIDDNQRIARLFGGTEYSLLGGTAWLWANQNFRDSVDVLFIDEAGQMSLADVLAVSAGAKSLVLLGDPQQLEQPQQASHPPGTQASALEHLLGGAKTIAAERGLFLQQTHRLHPSICAFTAEVFYENRLHSFPGLEHQAVLAPARSNAAALGSHGLVYVPVDHDGNQARAAEEVAAIERLVAALTTHGVSWRAASGETVPLTRADLMIVAPYNAQVTALGERLPDVRVGTVDKFQGQQAPVVIVSLTTSTPDDAPRGMDFLYSGNRLNVATSRARALCILVGNPRLFEPDCRTPQQMRLANAFCRYRELAREVREAFQGELF